MPGENPLDAPILIEFHDRYAVEVSRGIAADLAEKSEQAFDKAMTILHGIVQRINNTLSSLDVKPAQVDVEFGLKFNSEAGVLVAKMGTEGNLKVKMTWKA